jgi:hypothetical protein
VFNNFNIAYTPLFNRWPFLFRKSGAKLIDAKAIALYKPDNTLYFTLAGCKAY